MIYLILETSSPKGLLSLIEDNQILLSKEVPFGVRESGELVPILEQALEQLNLEVRDLSKIILGIGPGSFTGLRIGASVAKAFSFAQNIPIIGVSSLMSFEPATDGPFGVVLDAKLHGIYLQKGRKEGSKIIFEGEAKIYSTQALASEVRDLPYLLTTQKDPIKKKLQDFEDLPEIYECTPSPTQMLKVALDKPLSDHLKAQDQLDLTYFNTIT